jgi:hypothetical protein
MIKLGLQKFAAAHVREHLTGWLKDTHKSVPVLSGWCGVNLGVTWATDVLV